MKKKFKLITTFIMLLSMLTIKLSAQLSGVVTIDKNAPASATNYTSFSTLASTLNTSGVSGPLTVNVVSASGPYIEQASFGAIAGVSATNTITINGNGNTLTFSASVLANAWTLNLNGSDYMSFNNLNVIGSSTTIAFACVLNSGADHNSFTSCTFSCPLTSTVSSNQYVIMINGNNSGNQNNSNNSANYTTFKNCSMIGGYNSIFMYNPSAPPFSTNNTFDNCIIRDFTFTGLYSFWSTNLTVKGCTLDRPTRTAGATAGVNAMQILHNQNALIEGNLIEKIFDAQLTSTGTFNGILLQSSSAVTSTGTYNTFRNNVIRNIRSNGGLNGISGSAAGAANGVIYHNTISFDDLTSTSTGSTIGISMSGAQGYVTEIKNNCISITRGGTGTKICFAANTGGNSTVDYNNYYLNAAGTSNYIGVYNGVTCSNLAALQAQGIDAHSLSTDPQFTSLPSNVIPMSTVMNNQGTPVGTVSDFLSFNRSGSSPDIGAYEYLSANCTGVSTTSSITGPSQPPCFGETSNLILNGTTGDLGITYQWLASTNSASGPWTVIAGANTAAYTTPPATGNIYYGVEIICLLNSATATVATLVNMAATTTSTVPYYEGFEGISKLHKLPNCSWSASDLGSGCLTYTSTYLTSPNYGRSPRTGSNFASFFITPLGDKYFYTNGIQLNAGITYSAGLWYQTDFNLYNNFTDMSILYGTTQSTTGLVSIVSTGGSAASVGYKSLSNTFTVATSGIYYLAIKATAVSGNALYLNWDDLFITIPCSLNTPSVTLSSSSNTICATQSVVLSAGGAHNFLWNTGANTNSITVYPTGSSSYSVTGTNTLSGCSNTVTQYITVNPLPSILAHAATASVCSGSSVNLTALGNADTYTWSTGSSNLNISVSPSVNTTYTLSGANSYGCVSISTVSIAVVATPTINASSSTPTACAGESQSLTATGAVTYQWIAGISGLVLSGSSVTVNPLATTVYTVTGTDLAGCSGKFTLTQTVNECLGLNQINASLSGLKIYPNPTSGEFIVELNNSSLKTIEVIDITGRLVLINNSTSELVNINMNELSNGIYYVKVQSNNAVEVIKVVKQ